jgi:AhpD family alkylhydroperoxidase
MQPRLDFTHADQQAYKAMAGLEVYVRHSGLDLKLLHLIKVRASQINGCAYCIDMHWKDARADGESEQRLYGLSAWREAPYYTDRERAALSWTEAITKISVDQAPDEVYEEARRFFTEKEIVPLTMAIVAINGWNRLAIGFRALPGSYQPQQQQQLTGTPR